MTARSGYSVFEVLVAFAIMTLVLSALLPGQARLLARATSNDDEVLAYDLALSRLATLSVAGSLTPGETSSDHGPWRAIETVRSSGSEDGVTRFDLTVTILEANGQGLAKATNRRYVSDE